jgi:hypothetical protein
MTRFIHDKFAKDYLEELLKITEKSRHQKKYQEKLKK